MSTFLTPVPSSSLRVTGADRVDFVHGQMTNDLRGAPVPSYVAAAFLNMRGQMEAFGRIYRRADDLYIHLDAGQAEGLAARLKRYIIFDQVELTDLSEELKTLHLWGTWPLLEVGDWPTEDVRVGAAFTVMLNGAAVLLGAVDRSGTVGLDLHYLARQEDEVMAVLGKLPDLTERPWTDLQAVRVAAGLPEPILDGFLGHLPQEVGLDVSGPLPAISYRKGCYVGQEIMARLEARGRSRYGLSLLRVPAATPVGAEIEAGGKVVGQTGLEAGGLALARLRLDLPGDAALTVGGQAVAVATDTPFTDAR